jgi:glucose-6-phosphate dehydrogenase assembly protein OpcA
MVAAGVLTRRGRCWYGRAIDIDAWLLGRWGTPERHTGGRVAMMPQAPALTRAVKTGELTATGRNGAPMNLLEQAMEALMKRVRQVVREKADERPHR